MAFRRLSSTRLADIIDLGHRRRLERIERFDLPPDVICEYCGDGGIDLESHALCFCATGERIAAQHQKAKQWADNIPARLATYSLDTIPNPAIRKRVTAWLDADPIRTGQNLVLMGAVGGGKTGAGIALLRAFHETGASYAFHDAPSLFPRIASEQYGDDDRPSEHDNYVGKTMFACCHRSVLMLDDVGAERKTGSGYREDILFQIINTRNEHLLPTIITTNLDATGLADHLGPRLQSRLFQSCDAVLFDARSGVRDYRVNA